MNNPTKLDLRQVLTYAKFNDAGINVYERMLIHQNICQKLPFNKKLSAKVSDVLKRIKAEKWKAPVYRYNEDRVIEVYDEEFEIWRTFDKSQKQ